MQKKALIISLTQLENNIITIKIENTYQENIYLDFFLYMNWILVHH